MMEVLCLDELPWTLSLRRKKNSTFVQLMFLSQRECLYVVFLRLRFDLSL